MVLPAIVTAQELAKIPLLIARIEALERELARYKTKKDSNNSSLPPSKDENRPPRTVSLREKGNRKAGGQPGHDGKTLEMTADPDKIVEHRACFCPECGKVVESDQEMLNDIFAVQIREGVFIVC